VKITGLAELVRELKGPLFKDVNRELRTEAKAIADTLVPVIAAAVMESPSSQAAAFAATVRAKSDRVPVVSIGGMVNPKLVGFSRRGARKDGEDRAPVKLRRGAMAHGVVYGPKGGRRDTDPDENYYGHGRDDSGGRVGRAVAATGPAFKKAEEAYLRAFFTILERHGWLGLSHSLKGRV
jgi:hypothetical protein